MKYIHELGPLFHDVQMAAIFPDGKTFPDCLPKANLVSIAQQYEAEKALPGFDLRAFVLANFELPPSSVAPTLVGATPTARQRSISGRCGTCCGGRSATGR